jgi:hypothetical protein
MGGPWIVVWIGWMTNRGNKQHGLGGFRLNLAAGSPLFSYVLAL